MRRGQSLFDIVMINASAPLLLHRMADERYRHKRKSFCTIISLRVGTRPILENCHLYTQFMSTRDLKDFSFTYAGNIPMPASTEALRAASPPASQSILIECILHLERLLVGYPFAVHYFLPSCLTVCYLRSLLA